MAKATCKIEGCPRSRRRARMVQHALPALAEQRRSARQSSGGRSRPPYASAIDCDEPGSHARDSACAITARCRKRSAARARLRTATRPWYARGLCGLHYSRFMRTGSTDRHRSQTSTAMLRRRLRRAGHERARCAQRITRNWRKYGTPEVATQARTRVTEWPCIVEGCADLAAPQERHVQRATTAEA